jgi:hypothetical protein
MSIPAIFFLEMKLIKLMELFLATFRGSSGMSFFAFEDVNFEDVKKYKAVW